MIKMRRIVLLPAIAALAAFAVYVYLNPFMFMPVETKDCGSDVNCIREMEAMKDGCVPSSTIITGRDGIILMVNITREGDKCIRTESVVDSGNDSYLLNHSNTCEFGLSQLGNSSATACLGSIYDFVKPPPEEVGHVGSGTVQKDPFPNCGFYDYDCKEKISSTVQNCVEYEMTDVDMKWEPGGYWVGLIRVERINDSCSIYLQVLNAVNLPPDVPSDIIGSYMTCTVPLSDIPVTYIPESSCIGNLYPYLYQIAY
jgi:hypothetical protein